MYYYYKLGSNWKAYHLMLLKTLLLNAHTIIIYIL